LNLYTAHSYFNEDRAILYNDSTNQSVIITPSGEIVKTYDMDILYRIQHFHNSRAIFLTRNNDSHGTNTYHIIDTSGNTIFSLSEYVDDDGRHSYHALGNFSCDRVVFHKTINRNSVKILLIFDKDGNLITYLRY